MITCPDGTLIIALNRINISCVDPVQTDPRDINCQDAVQLSYLTSKWLPRPLPPSSINHMLNKVLIVDASESGLEVSSHFNDGNYSVQRVLISEDGDIYPDMGQLYKTDKHENIVVFIDGADVVTCTSATGRSIKGLLNLLEMICN